LLRARQPGGDEGGLAEARGGGDEDEFVGQAEGLIETVVEMGAVDEILTRSGAVEFGGQ